MLIEVRTDRNIQGSERFSDHVKAEVQDALERHINHVRRVDVHLSDDVGNKPGHNDKCCMIEVRRDGREPIVITHHENTMDRAIQGAIHNLKKSVTAPSEKNPTEIISGITTNFGETAMELQRRRET